MAGSVARLKKVIPIFTRQRKECFHQCRYGRLARSRYDLQSFEEVLSHPELSLYTSVLWQAYLKESERDVQRLLSLAKNRGAPITIRLVKGAYWDQEVVHANLHGYPIPVFTDKARTDVNYEKLSRLMLQNIDHLSPAFGSHNIRSVAHALAWAKEEKAPERSFEIQMLYGMAEPERKTFRKQGHRVRVYAPVGELLPGMAYLVRRLLENTSNDGFLKLSYHDNVDTGALKSPEPIKEETALIENQNHWMPPLTALMPTSHSVLEERFFKTPLMPWPMRFCTKSWWPSGIQSQCDHTLARNAQRFKN